ncbi:MAG: class I SAM-dependent methyltransferase [Ferruginibacter sp.]
MKFFSYLKYFFYIAYNWNMRIAWHISRQEIEGEKKYGINTTGADELKKLEKKGIDISHATIYMPVSYALLDEIFKQVNYNKLQTHFLDIGCGKGRALCVAAHKGFTKVTGIDFSKELCEVVKENLVLTKQKFTALQFNVINNDAFYFEIPGDVDCIFFFNPFDEIIMSGVVENIMISLKENPRKISIIYVNPLHKEIFIAAEFTETWYSKKMKYLEVSILENK